MVVVVDETSLDCCLVEHYLIDSQTTQHGKLAR